MPQPRAPCDGMPRPPSVNSQLPSDVHGKADRRRVDDRPRPADALARIAMREEDEHRRHAKAHRIDIARGVRNRPRIGPEPGEQRLHAGERADERHGEHQCEPDTLAEASADLFVAPATVGVGDERRDRHQDAEPEQPEHLVVAAADGHPCEWLGAEPTGDHRVHEHHARQHEVVDEQRPREPKDRSRITRKGIPEAACFNHPAPGSRRGGSVGMLAF